MRELLQPAVGKLAIVDFCNQQLQKCCPPSAELRPFFPSNEELVRRLGAVTAALQGPE